MAGVPELACGDLATESLESLWKDSIVCRDLRSASVEKKPLCRSCELKFLCGGGDLEHGYWTTVSDGSGQGSFLAHDPYCELYRGLADDALSDLARDGQATVQSRSGFDRPVVFRAMGEHTLHDDAATGAVPALVRTTHSACVLSEEVMERSRLTVREFYGGAAEEPNAELCCPVQPDAEDLAHIPKEVVERFYGCGSPVTAAALNEGESMVDLGSGAGIDCFIAAKKVGETGRVYGIDMTDQMLQVARECQPKVAEVLGYDAVEFRKGYLEEVPLDDAVANVVTSNCVINLSPDKPRVLREIWRVLKDHGRLVVADIVSDREVPPRMRADGQLWGECISGALTEDAFLSALERSGFYGVSIFKKTFWARSGGVHILVGDGAWVQVREESRLSIRGAVRDLSRTSESGGRRGRTPLPAWDANRSVHRHRVEALEPTVCRVVRPRGGADERPRRYGEGRRGVWAGVLLGNVVQPPVISEKPHPRVAALSEA